MQPDIEPRRLARIVIRRERHAIGKHRTIDFGGISKNLPTPLVPLWLLRLELLTALDALIECCHRVIDRRGRGKHIRILNEHLAGMGVDGDIVQQLRLCAARFQILHQRSNLLGLLLDRRKLLRVSLNRGRRRAGPATASRAPRWVAGGAGC